MPKHYYTLIEFDTESMARCYKSDDTEFYSVSFRRAAEMFRRQRWFATAEEAVEFLTYLIERD